MTKKDARQIGYERGLEAIENGDYSSEERVDEESFSDAFYEIIENAQQYDDYADLAYTFNKARNSQALWDAYEEGISDALNEYIETHY